VGEIKGLQRGHDRIGPPSLPRQQQEAIQVAHDILAGGQWGDVERITFHQQLAQLDPAQAMQRLVQAIDNGSLKVATVGPPL